MLHIKNIESYYDLVLALRGISMEVPEGSITTIIGNNGAGKTTILKTVMGLLEDQPDKGSIRFLDNPIDGKDTEDIVRLGISYVPEGREVFEELTVQENLFMGAYIRKDSRDVHKDYKTTFEYFPVLLERQQQLAGTLSGGEQQMLAIGRALMNKPRLLLLDEPSLGLSPAMVKSIFSIIETINKNGVTILLVEQNAYMALKVADYGYVLENGRIVMAGNCNELEKDKDIREFFLGQRANNSVKGFQRWKRRKRWR